MGKFWEIIVVVLFLMLLYGFLSYNEPISANLNNPQKSYSTNQVIITDYKMEDVRDYYEPKRKNYRRERYYDDKNKYYYEQKRVEDSCARDDVMKSYISRNACYANKLSCGNFELGRWNSSLEKCGC